MLKTDMQPTPCTMLDDQEGFQYTIYFSSQTKEPANTPPVLDTLQQHGHFCPSHSAGLAAS